MTIAVSIIWLIFAILFFVLGRRHWDASKKDIPHFELSERPLAGQVLVEIGGADVDQPIRDFAADFNSFVNEQNESSRRQNKYSAYGYWMAALMALVSTFLEWR